MGKLSGIYTNLLEKIKNMSTRRKIAFGVIFLGIVAAIVLSVVYTGSNKYGLLYAGLSADDGLMVTEKLKEKKIESQIRGNSIYVPKEQVDALKLELAPSITSGSKGFELMDAGSTFGMTDEEFKIKKQRMFQGELEKTIKSLSQIENARVHLTLPEETAFVKDTKPGKAAVYLQLKTGAKLNVDQIKAIVSLISGSIQNIPKENVEVLDDKMNLLSKDIFKENADLLSASALVNQQSIEVDFEKRLENNVIDLLEPAIGKDKVKVKVNADLDFDAKEKTTITYDPNKVEVSTHTIKENNSANANQATQSPVDNNMNNTTPVGTGNNTTSSKEEVTNNYNVGKAESKTISAPGEVKRVTASVMVDGKLDDATKQEIQKAVGSAIGYKADRGDEISVVGLNFDQTAKNDAKAEIEAMKKQMENEQRMALYRTSAIGAGGLIAFIVLLILMFRARKPKEKLIPAGIDVVIGDEISPKERVEFAPLELEREDENHHIEKEIKKYATEKPEQVADIIKSWLSEDER
jgi:flagellar M-ring protein FliF